MSTVSNLRHPHTKIGRYPDRLVDAFQKCVHPLLILAYWCRWEYKGQLKLIINPLFMKTYITKFIFVAAFTILIASASFVFTNTVNAAGTCGDCGGGTIGGGTTGGDTGGEGSDPVVTSCRITATATSVAANGQYTVNWDVRNASVVRLTNQTVAAQGSLVFTMNPTAVYERHVIFGDGQNNDCDQEVIVYRSVPAPVCDISTSLAVVAVGQQFRISWVGTPAEGTVFRVNNTIVAATDAVTYTYPNDGRQSITVTMTGTNAGGNCTDAVTVSLPAAPTPTCDSFTSNLSSIVRGNSATLTWATTNADAVSITNVSGPFTVDGSKVVTPNVTTIYTLTATKGANSVTCVVPVTVTDVPTPLDPICNSFTANPTTINLGQSTTLTWATTNATTVNINNAVGNVLVDGSVPVSPLVTTTYTLTATKDAKSVTCAVPVTVIQPENPTVITCAANVTNFSANSSSIRRGESSTLTWNTTGLTNVRFDNLNATGLSGSVTVSPSDSITYTLIGTKGSQTINCPVTVSVSTSNGGGGGGGGSSSPTCKLTISDKNISLGERVTIKWDTSRATEVSLKDNHGKTLIDTDGKSSSAKKDLYDGEITIRPEKDTTYTLLAEKGSKDRTCKVSVDVEDTIVVTQVRDQQPLVAGIALTQVPYTGFEAGPFMTSVFYTLLAAWALYMAYVLVGRRNGMNASAFTPATVTADIVPSTVMYPTAVTSAPVFYQAPVAAVASTATVGYDAHVDATTAIEAQAHAAHVLLSSDATAYFIAATAGEDREVILSGVLAAAKASYPSEDGWVVVSADRMVELASKY